MSEKKRPFIVFGPGAAGPGMKLLLTYALADSFFDKTPKIREHTKQIVDKAIEKAMK